MIGQPPAQAAAPVQQLFDRALALHGAGLLSDAERLCVQVLEQRKGHFDALHLLGLILHQRGRNDEALDVLCAALKTQSNSASARASRGLVLMTLGRHREALADFERALAIKPDLVEALNNRGNALHCLGRHEDAIASYDRALALRPTHIDSLYNRGIALHALNRHAEAVAAYQRVLALKPDHADAHWNESVSRLALGDFTEGWRKFEWRWRTSDRKTPGLKFPLPLWRGDQPIDGKSILVYAEQGLGDTIQFVRYVPMLAERGAKVLLAVHSELKQLVSRIAGAAAVFGENEQLPAVDFQCPLLSLPLAFGTTVATIPANIPYLAADEAAVAQWRERLPQSARLRVGLVWFGSPANNNDRARSLSLARLAPLLASEGVAFVSLHRGCDLSPDDAALLANDHRIMQLPGREPGFVDAAAIISSLDLVVAADTSLAHLAGALGKPVWILLPHASDWRWLMGRDDTPWYPKARLFRQPRRDDWDDVIARVGRELAALAGIARTEADA